MRRLAPVAQAEAAEAAFEVLDVFGGLFTLERRSPTLEGSVPVRVAQACVPLLEGNAYGFQVHLARSFRVERHLGRVRLVDESGVLDRRHAAALPRLLAHGVLDTEGPWHRALRGGPARTDTLPRRRPRLRLFTGLLLRPRAGTWLRVGAAANRRNTLLAVEETLVPDDGAFVPLVLDITLPTTGLGRVRLEGELACVAPVRPGLAVTVRSLAEAPEIGHAHARFYDQAYFDEKRAGGVTLKYRRLTSRAGEDGEPTSAACEVVRAGPAAFDVLDAPAFTTAGGPRPVKRPSEPRRLACVLFRNAIPFRALFDGHTVAIDADCGKVAAAAAAVERAWQDAYGASFATEHRGALLYLTKYFTPHPPGEPHFFVKPWALTRTPAGWSTLLDGVHGEGYDVLRGVVSTDVFHATPAVFRLWRDGQGIEVGEGAPLLRATPIPRALQSATFVTKCLPDEP